MTDILTAPLIIWARVLGKEKAREYFNETSDSEELQLRSRETKMPFEDKNPYIYVWQWIDTLYIFPLSGWLGKVRWLRCREMTLHGPRYSQLM
jgi:hypothetical protein